MIVILLILLWFLSLKLWTPKATGEYTYSDQFLTKDNMIMTADDSYLLPQISPRDYLYRLVGKDFEILDRIVECESGWRADAKNPNSSASGIFQFIASSWKHWGEGDVFDPYKNIEAGVRYFQNSGTTPWNASISCWATREVSTKNIFGDR